MQNALHTSSMTPCRFPAFQVIVHLPLQNKISNERQCEYGCEVGYTTFKFVARLIFQALPLTPEAVRWIPRTMPCMSTTGWTTAKVMQHNTSPVQNTVILFPSHLPDSTDKEEVRVHRSANPRNNLLTNTTEIALVLQPKLRSKSRIKSAHIFCQMNP